VGPDAILAGDAGFLMPTLIEIAQSINFWADASDVKMHIAKRTLSASRSLRFLAS
jgi:hypothetical protein